MNKRIILLSGPSGCGKDVAAAFLCSRYFFYHAKFANPIRGVMEALLGKFTSAADYEYFKLKPVTPDAMTGRQLMIDFSENFIKPRFGKDFFGRVLAQNLINGALDEQHIVISDCGFQEEIEAFVEVYGDWLLDCHIPHDFELWRIHRPGHSFDGDSRSYPNTTYPVPRDIHNDSSLVAFLDKIKQEFCALQDDSEFQEAS